MKQLSRDIKSMLTKTAFNIPPHLVGKTLASPKRRLIAILTDFIIASILIKTIGSGLYLVVGLFFIFASFIPVVRNKIRRRTRIIFIVIGLIMFLSYGINYYGKHFNQEIISSFLNGDFKTKEDSVLSQEAINKIKVRVDADTSGQVLKALGTIKINDQKVSDLIHIKNINQISPDSISTKKLNMVENFYFAFKSKDSIEIANNWQPMEALIAGKKLTNFRLEIDSLVEVIDDLEEELDDTKELLEEPSFSYIVKAAINDIGLSLGWFAFYLIFCWYLFDGSSPGKYLFHIKIIRMNGHPLKLFYCFERFSGYAAGIATGLLGFLQIYWDDNRQCIHDKIASTVVIDLKPKPRK